MLLDLEDLALESVFSLMASGPYQEDTNLENPSVLVKGWEPGSDWSLYCLIKT